MAVDALLFPGSNRFLDERAHYSHLGSGYGTQAISLGPKGGTGKSPLAYGVATILACYTKAKVLLFNIDTARKKFGRVGFTPKRGLAQALVDVRRDGGNQLDRDVFKRCISNVDLRSLGLPRGYNPAGELFVGSLVSEADNFDAAKSEYARYVNTRDSGRDLFSYDLARIIKENSLGFDYVIIDAPADASSLVTEVAGISDIMLASVDVSLDDSAESFENLVRDFISYDAKSAFDGLLPLKYIDYLFKMYPYMFSTQYQDGSGSLAGFRDVLAARAKQDNEARARKGESRIDYVGIFDRILLDTTYYVLDVRGPDRNERRLRLLERRIEDAFGVSVVPVAVLPFNSTMNNDWRDGRISAATRPDLPISLAYGGIAEFVQSYDRSTRTLRGESSDIVGTMSSSVRYGILDGVKRRISGKRPEHLFDMRREMNDIARYSRFQREKSL
ncbi:MAG: ParA family protein [Candidatus Aenigmatarchaeota archaeon]